MNDDCNDGDNNDDDDDGNEDDGFMMIISYCWGDVDNEQCYLHMLGLH